MSHYVSIFVTCVEWGKGCVNESWHGTRGLKFWCHTSLLLQRFTSTCFLKIHTTKLRSWLVWAKCTFRNSIGRFPVRNAPWLWLAWQSSLLGGREVRPACLLLLWSTFFLWGISYGFIRSLSQKGDFVYGSSHTLPASFYFRKRKIITSGTWCEVEIPGGALDIRANTLGLNSYVGKQLLTLVPGFVQMLIELFAAWQKWLLL